MATKYRQRILDHVRQLKETTGCVDCGPDIRHPYYRLQFDHLPGHDKVERINRLIWRASHATILEEIDKCDIVCANCHADRTYKRQMGLMD
jgi:hypothetical protein